MSINPEMNNLRPVLGDIVSSIETRAPYGAIFLSSNSGMSIFIDNQQETVSQGDPTAGSVITAFDGHTMRERAIGGFDKDSIQRGAQAMLSEATFTNHKKIDPGPEHQRDFVTAMEIDPTTLSTKEKLESLRDLHQRVKNMDSQIVNVRIQYREVREQSIFRNRHADLAQDIQRLVLFVFLTVSNDSGIRFNWLGKYGTAGWEILSFSDDELQDFVETSFHLLKAERVEPGEYSIITHPSVSGTLAHESFGHGVETDMFLKDRAQASSYLGRRVASPDVEIWDDPSLPGEYGSYFFDHEGRIAEGTQIVDQGIFQRGLTDLYSATALNIPRSPNGRRQDFSRKAYARMSNTFFGRGTTPVSDLFNQVEDGIYLKKSSSGMEDPKGWGIQVTCHYGYEIKQGKVTGRMFAPIALTGSVPHVLQSISSVGDDLIITGGTCGKGHKEMVPVSSGGPHLLLRARLG